MKRPVRQSKYEPMVEKVELLDANPEYAHVRLPDGHETTVSVRHLAPAGTPPTDVSPPGISSPRISPSGSATPGDGMDAANETVGLDDRGAIGERPRRGTRLLKGHGGLPPMILLSTPGGAVG